MVSIEGNWSLISAKWMPRSEPQRKVVGYIEPKSVFELINNVLSQMTLKSHTAMEISKG